VQQHNRQQKVAFCFQMLYDIVSDGSKYLITVKQTHLNIQPRLMLPYWKICPQI